MRIIILIIFLIIDLFSNAIDINTTKNFFELDREGNINPSVYKILNKIEHDRSILCDKSRYNIYLIKEKLFDYSFEKNSEKLNDLKILINRAFNQYFYDLNHGCIKKENFLKILPQKENLDIQENLIYNNLLNALKKYVLIEKKGSWDKIEKNFYILKKGDSNQVIIKIKKRLKLSGDYKCENIDNIFDQCLEDSVKIFQKRHGLKVDGKIGPETIKYMNISLKDKILKIVLNIERLRWILENDNDFILINIPDFSLDFFKNKHKTLHMKVIVGREDRQTPIMKDYIKYAVLNPYWKAPKTIVQKDILPKLQKRKFEYLKNKHIIASLDWDGNDTIEYENVDWSLYNADNIPFVFMQKPGPQNFLGFIKFIFPNSEDIYIHDTPEQNLFKYKKRAFSSGCIRVKKPIELFYNLYNLNSEKITYRDILEKLVNKETKIIPFDKKIRVYILYMTAFVDDEGLINFRDDIYNIDKKMKDFIKQNGDFLVK
ncbi:L,D-transpeptidase family protein [Nitrosophilus kaiyonis]|uniref:L,D-transpeptidase family protein n=1 Tax=Nitrosophilus kaiyonis TaxID=2930200 RepID=UPI0024915821|nr:L,D-transpeptidase family protein [Nitrosophilus kaiyonis]